MSGKKEASSCEKTTSNRNMRKMINIAHVFNSPKTNVLPPRDSLSWWDFCLISYLSRACRVAPMCRRPFGRELFTSITSNSLVWYTHICAPTPPIYSKRCSMLQTLASKEVITIVTQSSLQQTGLTHFLILYLDMWS